MAKGKRVLNDTGPLVAILSSNDQHHPECVEELKRHRTPLLTCWPVAVEAAWLLRREQEGVRRLFQLIETQVVELVELDHQAIIRIPRFLEQYASMEPDIADAALIYLAEREHIKTVFSVDRRDFSIYRLSDGTALRIVPEA